MSSLWSPQPYQELFTRGDAQILRWPWSSGGFLLIVTGMFLVWKCWFTELARSSKCWHLRKLAVLDASFQRFWFSLETSIFLIGNKQLFFWNEKLNLRKCNQFVILSRLVQPAVQVLQVLFHSVSLYFVMKRKWLLDASLFIILFPRSS